MQSSRGLPRPDCREVPSGITFHKENFTQSIPRVSPASNTRLWTGRILSGIIIVFLLFDGIIKLIPIAPVIETMQHLGYSGDITPVARGLGILTLVIVVLYGIPRTAILGAILLTGLMGGAMATHLRVGSPLFTHLLFGLYLGLMAWGGLYLRDDRFRAMIPLASEKTDV